MSQPTVTMLVHRPSSTASVIEIAGEVTAAAENALMDAYTQAAEGDARAIVLDFRDLGYMNSSGIGLLVTLLIRANRRGQKLLATGLNQHYQHIFELTRLDEAIRIFPSETAALAAVV